VGDGDSIQIVGIACIAQGEAEIPIAEQRGHRGEGAHVIVVPGVGDHEEKQQVNGVPVHGVEIDRLAQGDEHAKNVPAARHAAMRNRDALAEPGAAELFPGHERAKHRARVNARGIVGDQFADPVEQSFSAVALDRA